MDQWANGPVGQWANGQMGLNLEEYVRQAWGVTGQWADGPMGQWATGPMGQLDHWAKWASGSMGPCANGPNPRGIRASDLGSDGPMCRWANGPMCQWANGPIGPLGKWTSGMGQWA